MALGLSSPLPRRRPRGGRAARARGTRGSLRRPLADAAGASGGHPFLLRFSRKAQRRRREREIWSASRVSTPGGRQRSGG